jgi:uncharacterized protein HemY
MEEIKIYTQPMTEEEAKENMGKPLKMPVRYHLIDCLKELQFGRPTNNQEQIQEWIDQLNENLDKGVPFS